jgi:hypothetical protein
MRFSDCEALSRRGFISKDHSCCGMCSSSRNKIKQPNGMVLRVCCVTKRWLCDNGLVYFRGEGNFRSRKDLLGTTRCYFE